MIKLNIQKPQLMSEINFLDNQEFLKCYFLKECVAHFFYYDKKLKLQNLPCEFKEKKLFYKKNKYILYLYIKELNQYLFCNFKLVENNLLCTSEGFSIKKKNRVFDEDYKLNFISWQDAVLIPDELLAKRKDLKNYTSLKDLKKLSNTRIKTFVIYQYRFEQFYQPKKFILELICFNEDLRVFYFNTTIKIDCFTEEEKKEEVAFFYKDKKCGVRMDFFCIDKKYYIQLIKEREYYLGGEEIIFTYILYFNNGLLKCLHDRRYEMYELESKPESELLRLKDFDKSIKATIRN